jgi:hypothetical protein
VISTEAMTRLRRLPRIRRARGYRLYTVDGRRLLDMWQDDGRSILGHRGAGVNSGLKRVIDRGVTGALPSAQEHRLEQSVRRLFGGARELSVAVYATRERALEALSRSLEPAGGSLVADPAFAVAASGPRAATGVTVSLWRPFLADATVAGGDAADGGATTRASILLPVLPCGGLFEAQVVVAPRDADIDLRSDLLPEPVLVSLTLAADALLSAPAPPVVALRGFDALGPYRVPTEAVAGDYEAVFGAFLEAGILLSPDPALPSIVPGELSDGERAQIERVAW